MLCSGAFSVPSFRAAGGTSLGGDSLRPFRTTFSRSAYITDVIFFMLCPIHIVANSALVKILPPQQGDRRGRRGRLSVRWNMLGGGSRGSRRGLLSRADVGSPPGCISCVSFWCLMQGVLLGADVESPPGGLCRVSFR